MDETPLSSLNIERFTMGGEPLGSGNFPKSLSVIGPNLELAGTDEVEPEDAIFLQEPRTWTAVIILLPILCFALFRIRHLSRTLERKVLEMEELQRTMEERYMVKETVRDAETQKRQELEKELDFKNKQLTSYAFSYEQKNRVIEQLEDLVKKFESSPTVADKKIYAKKLKVITKENLIADKNWEHFRNFFEESQYGFHAKLLSKHPNLKPNDLKLCSIIRLNLSIKETANVLGISTGSLKTSRYRLKKKMGLDLGQEIIDYLIGMEHAAPTDHGQEGLAEDRESD